MCRLHSLQNSHRHFRRKESERQAFFFPSRLVDRASAVWLEVIYKHSMDDSPKRSASVTAAAVVAILGGLFLLLCLSVPLLALLFVKFPGPASDLPPSFTTFCLPPPRFFIS